MIRLKVVHRGLIVLLIPLLAQIALVWYIASQLTAFAPSVSQEMGALEMGTHLDKLMNCVMDSTGSAVLFFLTKGATVMQHQQKAKDMTWRTFGELEQMSKDDREPLKQVMLLQLPLENMTRESDKLVKGEASDSLLQMLVQQRGKSWSEIFADPTLWPCQFLITNEKHSTHDAIIVREDFARRMGRLLTTIVISDIVLAALLFTYYYFSIVRRMRTVLSNSKRIEAGAPLNQAVGGGDEISALDSALTECAQSVLEVEQFEKDLTSVVTEELKVPLTSLQGMLFLLNSATDTALSDRTHKSLVRAEQNVSWLVRMVNDLVDLERVREGISPLMKSSFQLESMIKAACEKVQPLAKKENVVVDVYGVDGAIVGDYERLLKVTVNLLSTAIRASALGGKIVVDYEVTAGQAQVKITDTSTGLAETMKGKLFDQFQLQPDRMLNEDVPSGLELPLCHAIVLQHAGEIKVESLGRRGCIYYFSVPDGSDGGEAQPITLKQADGKVEEKSA